MHLREAKNPHTPKDTWRFESPANNAYAPSVGIHWICTLFASRAAASAPRETTDLITRRVEGAEDHASSSRMRSTTV